MSRRSIVVVFTALALMLPGSSLAADRKTPAKDVYIVLMTEQPAVAYTGGIAGYEATATAKGGKVDSTKPSVQKYAAYLRGRHAKVLTDLAIDVRAKFYDYTFSLNGFAAVLSGKDAARVRATKGVWSVQRDALHKAETDTSPDFLGLTAPGGLWTQTELPGVEGSGEDVIVGVIDTGIWPEHPSFSDQADLGDRSGESAKRQRVYDAPPAYWHGTCQSGENWSQDDCNNKLIGARYFLDGYGHHGVIQGDFKSARDKDGHGTHTASTAAGNKGVQAKIFGVDRGTVSGMAPRARIAAYKALWNDQGGYTSDLAAAVDAAVADGVDVINYSIGSSTPSLISADDLAFLFANRAGVFVASSAGNDGPGPSTIGSPASVPWLTTVGASTHDRTFQGAVTLGNGATYTGASVTEGVSSRSLVDGAAAGSALCIVGALDPAKVTGKIVLCKRGTNDRVQKSLAVKQAGGAGMVLYNATATQDGVTDSHWVPSVHVSLANGLAIKSYITASPATATASITGGQKVPTQGSKMADFSSRGPNGASADILKPDVTAPGVNILAGNTPVPFAGRPGQLFQSISGTSMSSPHVAGIGALLVQKHRTWTPDQIKSALMVSSRQDVTKEDGVTAADPFDMGAGHIVPNRAVGPGLTLQATFNEYVKFLCGANAGLSASTCTSFGSIDPSDLNLASIAIGELAGQQTVTRRFTSVVGSATTWTTSTEGLTGVSASMPATLAVPANGTAALPITFTRTSASMNEWVFGAIRLTNGSQVVRLPVTVRPVPISAPLSQTITATGATASKSWTVKVGYAGTLSADGYGLAADAITAGQSVAQDPDQDIETDTFGAGTKSYDFTLTPTARYYAGGTRESTTTPGSDLDVFLFHDAGNDGFTYSDLVTSSADGDSEEIVQLVSPAAGKYRLVVHGWGTAGGSSAFSLHQWTVDQAAADTGTLVATAGSGDPKTVATGEIVTVTANASGLTAPGQYRGVVGYSDGSSTLATTVVLVDR